MKKLFDIISKIASSMTKSSFTTPIYRFLFNIGAVRLGHYLFSLNFRKNPTQAMNYEKQFFSEHTEELKEVYDILEDDKSRTAFENALKYRLTYDWTYLKKSMAIDNVNNQYLVPELHFSEHEVIVDCGAYIGDTAKKFFEKIPGCTVISLEPDKKNFETLQGLKLERLKPINCGAWSKDTTLNFSDGGGGTPGGAISDSGSTKIEVRALDNLPECQSATYIKMDIEGAELEALKGAENLIKEKKPKLAICIYHKSQDFFEIPLYIKKLNPDYKLFVYHHYYNFAETVIYAI